MNTCLKNNGFMPSLKGVQKQLDSILTKLVVEALDQPKLSGLSQMLKVLANAVNATGVVLWRLYPSLQSEKELQ